jgi:hypothetical protein
VDDSLKGDGTNILIAGKLMTASTKGDGMNIAAQFAFFATPNAV